MKNSLLLILLFSRLCSSAQVHTTSRDSLAATLSRVKVQDSLRLELIELDPDSSAIGEPTGEKATKTIGPEGGKVSSADGRMELVFPAGALTAPTEIGLQPVENTSFGGFGNAYACTPDGIHFQKPVQLLIRYPDSAAKGIPATMQTIRWQDKTGKWGQVEEMKVDSAAHSIACHIGHFSGYAPGTRYDLVALKTPLRVNRPRMYQFVITGIYPNGKRYTDKTDIEYWRNHYIEWKVSDIDGGDDIVGKIVGQDQPFLNFAVYTAPAVVPSENPVIMAKAIDDVPLGNDTYAAGISKYRPLIIYDDFHYSFTGFNQVGHLHMIDSATCDIRVLSSGAVQVTNIKNPVPWSDWPPKEGKCSYEYPDKTGWKGMVQIVGISGGKYYAPTASDPNASVMVHLTPSMGSSPTYIQHCPNGTRTIASMPVIATPTYIQFDAKPGGDIQVSYGPETGIGTILALKGGQGFSTTVSRKP